MYKCSEFRWAEHSAWSALNTALEQVLLHHNIVYISSVCGQAPVIIELEKLASTKPQCDFGARLMKR